MAESKRTFQAARMNKDIEEKILKPGEYRDALNVSVDFSEDGNIGAIENLKGNDARKRIVKLTPKGFEILDQAIPLLKEAEDEIFDESKKYGFSVL